LNPKTWMEQAAFAFVSATATAVSLASLINGGAEHCVHRSPRVLK
jgi:hypothetical protein